MVMVLLKFLRTTGVGGSFSCAPKPALDLAKTHFFAISICFHLNSILKQL